MTAKTDKAGKYVEAVGRRKTSTSRVRLTPASKLSFTINDRALSDYFKTEELQKIVNDPFVKGKAEDKFAVSATVKGGGIHSQAEAVRHGITRVLVDMDEAKRVGLKKLGFLKRDPRAKERRKFGLKKARKAPQWSKR